jgi:hypothetical protein
MMQYVIFTPIQHVPFLEQGKPMVHSTQMMEISMELHAWVWLLLPV